MLRVLDASEIEAIIKECYNEHHYGFLSAVIANTTTKSDFKVVVLEQDTRNALCLAHSEREGRLVVIWGPVQLEKFNRDMCRELLDFVIGLFPRKKNILFPFVNSGVLQFMKDDLEWVGHDYKMYVHQGLITNSGIECDSIKKEDILSILQLQTVSYSTDYIDRITQHWPFSEMNAVVRRNGRAASWCLTHDDFSVGLIGTNPDFQRQGLAAKAVRHTLEKRFNMFQALGRDYFSIGFVAKDNHPSHKLMQSVGFKPIEGYVVWAGKNLLNDSEQPISDHLNGKSDEQL